MWLEEQLLGGGGGLALNRGPQLRSHNDIGGGQAALCCPDGETEAGTPSMFEKGGASHQLFKAIHLPHEDTVTWGWSALSVATQCLD